MTMLAVVLAAPTPGGTGPAARADLPLDGDTTWSALGHDVVVVVLTAVVACVLTRWILPLLLRSFTPAAVDFVGMAATLVLLPEYLTTTALRRAHRPPWKAAYVFGDAVAWSAVAAQTITRSVLLGLSVMTRRIPLVLVASAAGALALARLLGGS
jgi:hypothetical protein